MTRIRSALTLLEVLLATTLLALIMAIVGAWSMRLLRLSDRFIQISHQHERDAAVRRLLRDDLLLALSDSDTEQIADRRQLVVRTLHRAAGDGPDGVAAVTWRHDAEQQQLVRQRGSERPRVIATDVIDLVCVHGISLASLRWQDSAGREHRISVAVGGP